MKIIKAIKDMMLMIILGIMLSIIHKFLSKEAKDALFTRIIEDFGLQDK